MSKIEELRWVRVFSPIHVPKYLIEQIKKRDYSVEEFYKYHEINCLQMTEEGPSLNPFSHLYVLVNTENLVKDVLWFTVDPLAKSICIQTYTVDKEYWNSGGSVRKLADHIKDIRRKGNLKKIYWVSDYPKHSQRHGFRMSKSVLMEYSEEEEENGKNTDGKHPEQRKHRSSDSRTEELSIEHTGESAGGSAECIQSIPSAV